jgi:hypothetical protein
MSKELDTQPYRSFKDFLDKIIKMPDDFKNRLAEEFERRRLELERIKREMPLEPEPEPEPVSEESSYKLPELFPESSQQPIEEKKDDKSFFDSIFSKEQTDTLLDKFSSQPTPQLTMANAPEHKCKIRAW